MDKSKKAIDPQEGNEVWDTGNNWIRETEGTKVQNPNQNKQIHKQSLGRNARR